MKKSERKVVISLLLFLVSWIIWINFSGHIALSVFVKNEWISGASVAFISLIISGVAIYRAKRSGRMPLDNWKAFGKGFLGLAVMIYMTFWHAPEVFVYITANDAVNNATTFTIMHPGPKTGKHSHCQAGVQYYDDYLKRDVELCANDGDIDINAKYIYVQRKVNRYGVNVQNVSFVR